MKLYSPHAVASVSSVSMYNLFRIKFVLKYFSNITYEKLSHYWSKVKLKWFLFYFFPPVSSLVYTQCLLVFFFLFPVALAKHLGVNITALKYKDSAQFHKKNSRREHVVILHSRLITNKSKRIESIHTLVSW